MFLAFSLDPTFTVSWEDEDFSLWFVEPSWSLESFFFLLFPFFKGGVYALRDLKEYWIGKAHGDSDLALSRLTSSSFSWTLVWLSFTLLGGV